MRIRSIRPEFWSSEDIAAMDWHARLVYIGLWSYVDDNGVGRDVERLIVTDLFPLDDDLSESSLRVHGALKHLEAAGNITRYRVDGKPYLHITAWEKHQKINRPTAGRYPLPTSDDAEIHDVLTEPSVSPHANAPLGEGEKGRRGEGEKGAPAKPKPPTGTRIPDDFEITDDMKAWADEKVPGLNTAWATEAFIDYWQSAAKNAVKKDWAAAWRGWMRRNFEDGKLGPRQTTTTNPQIPDWMLNG